MNTFEDDFEVKWKDVYPQLIGNTIMSLTSICGGLSNSFTNLLNDIVDKETKSWLASTTSLFTIIGTLIAGPLVDKIGRKSTLVTINIISILAWALILGADRDRSFLLFIGIPLTGVVRGGIAVINVVLISEVTHKKYRSTMLSYTLVYFTFGILLTSLFGILVPWKTVSLLCLIFFIGILILASFYTTESPIWLANIKMDTNAAKRCLQKLNPNEQLFEKEWLEMKENILINQKSSKEPKSIVQLLTKPSFYRPATVLFVILALSQLSGVNFMMYYVIDAVSKIGHDTGKQYKKEIFLMVGISKFSLSFFTTSLSTKFGRKQLLYASCCGTLTSSAIIIVCNILYGHFASYFMDWIMLLAYVMYMSFGSFGIWLVPYTLIGELLPNHLRGLCSPIFICFSYGVMFIGAKVFPLALESQSVINIFVFYILNSVITYIYVYYYVPETLGKTLKEIEQYFETNNS